MFHFSCENAGECVELDGDLIDIESDSDGGDTEGTCTDMEDAVDIENAVIENLGKDTLKSQFYCSDLDAEAADADQEDLMMALEFAIEEVKISILHFFIFIRI